MVRKYPKNVLDFEPLGMGKLPIAKLPEAAIKNIPLQPSVIDILDGAVDFNGTAGIDVFVLDVDALTRDELHLNVDIHSFDPDMDFLVFENLTLSAEEQYADLLESFDSLPGDYGFCDPADFTGEPWDGEFCIPRNYYTSIGYLDSFTGNVRYVTEFQTIFGGFVEVIAQSGAAPSVSVSSTGLVVVSVDESGTQYAEQRSGGISLTLFDDDGAALDMTTAEYSADLGNPELSILGQDGSYLHYATDFML